MQYIVKVITVLFLIIAITETSKRNQTLGALLASLPITSLIAILWLKYENAAPEVIMGLSRDIFWMVLPSLIFFAMFPYLLRHQINFWLSFVLSTGSTIAAYLLLLKAIKSA